MTTTQKAVFLNEEGDGWYSRNKIVGKKLEDKRVTDPALGVLKKFSAPPKRVLEIGASNGWRLSLLKEIWPEAQFFGIEPSAEAVEDAYAGVTLIRGTADDLPYEDGEFDLVLFGFCLYLCDRKDLFKIAAEADRVLADDGLMVAYDFHTEQPYKNAYAHTAQMHSYKMDYSQLFMWSPAYTMEQSVVSLHPGCTEDKPDNYVGVFVMRKNIAAGWPDNPYD